jgi:dimethylhistidine N-methyltransferase
MISTHVRALSNEQFRIDVLRGLGGPVKELPSKYFYDQAGSELFERITELEEYYPTRIELAIMKRQAREMANLLGSHCLLVEFGSGSSTKTRLLLDHLHEPVAYVPIDVSAQHLRRSAEALAAEYPEVKVLPLCTDFTEPLRIPALHRPAARRVVYFPGSTIGNLMPDETLTVLKRIARLCGPSGALLLGADLQKDPGVLEAAYNDAQGITAAFNRNLLERINRELEADFVVHQFGHRAFYNASEGRIEMHLVSLRGQWVRIENAEFVFAQGESIRTEYSYKYRIPHLRRLAEAAGLALRRFWTDERRYFSVLLFTVPEADRAGVRGGEISRVPD